MSEHCPYLLVGVLAGAVWTHRHVCGLGTLLTACVATRRLVFCNGHIHLGQQSTQALMLR